MRYIKYSKVSCCEDGDDRIAIDIDGCFIFKNEVICCCPYCGSELERKSYSGGDACTGVKPSEYDEYIEGFGEVEAEPGLVDDGYGEIKSIQSEIKDLKADMGSLKTVLSELIRHNQATRNMWAVIGDKKMTWEIKWKKISCCEDGDNRMLPPDCLGIGFKREDGKIVFIGQGVEYCPFCGVKIVIEAEEED